MHFRIRLVRNILFQGLALTQVVQADVGCNAVDRSVKTVFESESAERTKGFEEGLLENFTRLFAISQHVERQSQDVPIMPSDQLLKCFTISVLCLLDKEFLVFRLVNSLCGPFQYSFHGHG